MDVVTAAEKLRDWRVAWMCCSINAGRCDRDWFSDVVTAVSKAWFAGGFSGPNCRERAATSVWWLRRSWFSAMLVKVDPVVIDEIVVWLLGWKCGPIVQLFWLGCELVEAYGLGKGFGFPLGCCLGCCLGVCDMWGEFSIYKYHLSKISHCINTW